MLEIRNVKIEGFRGFPGSLDALEFSAPATMIFGDNHQGKSSILNAIEWCLFGDQCHGGRSGIRERVGNWEVVNRNADAAMVKLEIETEEGVFQFIRSEEKGKGKRGKGIEIKLPSEITIHGEEAEKLINKIIGLTFDDFATTVYQHQETIRHIVIQTPKDQSEAIDRLLGLSAYRDITGAIKNANLTRSQKDMLIRFNSFEEKVTQALEIRQKDLAEARKEVEDHGIASEYVSANGVINLSENIIAELSGFAGELGISPVQMDRPPDWERIGEFVETAKRELDRLWSESPEVKEQGDLLSRKMGAQKIKTTFELERGKIIEIEIELGKFQQEHGAEEILVEKTQILNSQLNQIKEEIKAVSPRSELIQEGIDILKNAVSVKATSICPLCGLEYPDLLEHLEKEWLEQIQAKVADLAEQESSVKPEIANYQGLLEQYSTFNSNLEMARDALGKRVSECEKFLETELGTEDDPAVLLMLEINKIDKRIKSVDTAIKSKRETLDRISKSIEGVKIANRVIGLNEKVLDIGRIETTDPYKELDIIRDEVAKLVNDVSIIGDIVTETMKEKAVEKLHNASDEIDEYFRMITANPAVDKLIIEITEGRGGTNEYKFCDSEGNELNPILSLGDLNGLALSIFLGLVKAYPHPVGFVMLDDPSQSLGKDQKKRLVDVLNQVCQEGRRIIVGTMDTELRGFLENNITKAKTIYELSNWSPDSGSELVKVL